MKIVVASTNPVKLGAVERAFASSFTGIHVEVIATAASSGISDQPMSDEETRHGARNRARRAMDQVADADYWIGIEGGIELIGDTLMAFAWMCVRAAGGRKGEARTVTLPLPNAIRKLIDDGMELGEANDVVFSTVNSKQAGGAFGLLTEGRYTRESVYVEALCMALVPIINPIYSK